jgi:hypothetical protein
MRRCPSCSASSAAGFKSTDNLPSLTSISTPAATNCLLTEAILRTALVLDFDFRGDVQAYFATRV